MDTKENPLILYQKYLELLYYTTDLVKKYPKNERFVLAQETRQSLYAGLKFILFAQKETLKINKLKYLNNLDVHLRLQKVYIRIAYKYKYINDNNYSAWSQKLTDICNMLGGWIKSCQTNKKMLL